MSEKDNSYIPIINRSDSCKLKVSDIRMVSRNNRKLVFDTEQGTKQTYAKIDDVEKYLSTDFVRCMSGCIVNLAKVTEIKDNCVHFDNGSSLRVGRDAYLILKQRFNAYLRNLSPDNSVIGPDPGGRSTKKKK